MGSQTKLEIEPIVHDFKLLDTWTIQLQSSVNRNLDLNELLPVLFAEREQRSIMDGLSDFLFQLRWALGKFFGWDRAINTLPIPGCRETSLRERIKEAGLSGQQTVPEETTAELTTVPFRTIYSSNREKMAELSNNTVHALIHYQVIQQETGASRLDLSIYVKPRGRLGWLYLALIMPFRHLIIYPTLIRNAHMNWKTYLASLNDDTDNIL